MVKLPMRIHEYLEMVEENSKRPPSKARHKLAKKSPLYLFQKLC